MLINKACASGLQDDEMCNVIAQVFYPPQEGNPGTLSPGEPTKSFQRFSIPDDLIRIRATPAKWDKESSPFSVPSPHEIY